MLDAVGTGRAKGGNSSCTKGGGKSCKPQCEDPCTGAGNVVGRVFHNTRAKEEARYSI